MAAATVLANAVDVAMGPAPAPALAPELELVRIETNAAKPAVVGLINTMQMRMFGAASNVSMELEARLGRIEESPVDGSTRFASGVDASFYEEVVSLFDEFDGWSDVGPVRMIVEHFYPCRLPTVSLSNVGDDARGATRDAEVRMVLCTDPTHESGPEAHRVDHVEKRRVDNVNVRTLVDYPLGSCGVPSDWWDVRFSLSEETRIDPDHLPQIVGPRHVRFMVRQTYAYRSASDGSLWHYDVTRTWSGATRAEAEQKMKGGAPPVYEIEIELADPGRSLASDAQTLAQSLLMKTADLFACSLDRLSSAGAGAHASDGAATVRWSPCTRIEWSRPAARNRS